MQIIAIMRYNGNLEMKWSEMKRALALLTIGIILVAGSAMARKPPNEVYYPVTIDKIGDFITDLDYKFDKITTSDGTERLNLRIQGDNTVLDVNILLFESLDMIYMYIAEYLSLPLNEPSSSMMLTYLMNKNWGLTFGKFEWDIDDGEVRYSHTLPIDDGISMETFQAYFSTMLNIADEQYPDLIESLEEFRD